jgi:hypothetical protein
MMKTFAFVLCVVFLAEAATAKEKTFKSCRVVEKDNAIDGFSKIDSTGVCSDDLGSNDAGSTYRYCGKECCNLVFSDMDGASGAENPIEVTFYNSETVRDARACNNSVLCISTRRSGGMSSPCAVKSSRP